jgi:hypothetical protein
MEEVETHLNDDYYGDATAKPTRIIRAIDPRNNRALEWQLLRGQGKVTQTLFIRGRLERSRWLVVRTDENRLFWPSTRAQPVIGKGMYVAWGPTGADSGIITAHHRLLAAYTNVLGESKNLPPIIRCPPGQGNSWWWLGVPRPLVESLVTRHLRRRLRSLRGALTCRALQSDVDDGGTHRRALREASQECQELADSLPRSASLALLVPVITIGFPIYATFFATPHINITIGFLIGLYLAWLFIGVVTIMIFYRSIRCKRALFSLSIVERPMTGASAQSFNEWNLYEFETEAFKRAGEIEPREFEGEQWILWLLGGVYGLAILIPMLIALGPVNFGLLFLFLFVLLSGLRIANTGLSKFVSLLRGILARIVRALDR